MGWKLSQISISSDNLLITEVDEKYFNFIIRSTAYHFHSVPSIVLFEESSTESVSLYWLLKLLRSRWVKLVHSIIDTDCMLIHSPQ